MHRKGKQTNGLASSMKLIHAADIHLDTCFADPRLPVDYGVRRRRQLRESFAAMLRHAWEGRFDAVLLAGDLFDRKYVTWETIVFLREQLERIAPIPVLISPGNRDPYTADSPYHLEAWPENVVIFDHPEWEAWDHPDIPLTIHGFGFNAKDVPGEIFCRLKLPRKDRVQVAMAHGAERDFLPPDHKPRGLFSLTDILQPGLSYLALGHVHRVLPLFDDDQCQAWYAGPLEGHDFDETGPTGFLEVTITPQENRPASVAVQPFAASPRVYHYISLAITEKAEEAIEALDKIENPQHAVVCMHLTGVVTAETRRELRKIVHHKAAQFAWLALEDSMETLEDYSAIAREDTVLGELVRRLIQARQDTTDPEQIARLSYCLEAGTAAFLGRPLPAGALDGGIG